MYLLYRKPSIPSIAIYGQQYSNISEDKNESNDTTEAKLRQFIVYRLKVGQYLV